MLEIFITEKKYGNHIVLKEVAIHLSENGIYGFFGKNGQGKTTLFHCILGFTHFQGKILFNGEELQSPDIAWLPTEPDMYEYLTGSEFADFYARNCGMKKVNPKNFLFEINSTNLIKEYSTGMKKKTYINAVLQSPHYKIYVFDEPFNDLDIEANYRLLQHIRQLAETHMVLLSSHIIEIILPYLKQCYFIDNTKVESCLPNTLTEKFFAGNHAS